jgi:hypothetical protein
MEYTLTRSTMKSPGESNLDRPSLSARREGVVILSEFVSSARVMGGAIIINPWKIDEVSDFASTSQSPLSLAHYLFVGHRGDLTKSGDASD